MIAVFHLSADRTPTEQRLAVMSTYNDQKLTVLCASLWVMGLYDAVAAVDTRDLDSAFQLTNNIEAPWPGNSGVSAVAEQLRSTSVGDVLLDHEGKFQLCAPMGWLDITEAVLQLVDAGGQKLREAGQPPVPYDLLSQLFAMQRSALRISGIPAETSPVRETIQ